MSENMNKQQLMDIKTDMKLLLECMTYQKDNPSALKQALVTLSSSLQSCNEAKDIFRDTGGLQSVLETVTRTKYGEVTEAGLYCLGSAVEGNVYSQKLLSTASTFTFIHNILSNAKDTSVRKKRTAAFLILCLVSNNGFGQNLARQSSCLHDVIMLIRRSLPKSTSESSEWLEGLEGTSVALWSTLVSTACVCVNNPLNEENQRICASLLPYLLNLLEDQPSPSISRPVLSLIGLTVANNPQNQDRVRKCGGLDTLVKLLENLVSKIGSGSDGKTTAVHLLNTLDSCISDNEENARKIGKLGAISLMLKMLTDRNLEDQDRTQVVLTLAHAADIHEQNRNNIRDSGGITSMIQQLTLTENEELSKTVKYLLHMCVSSEKEIAVDLDENSNLPVADPMVTNMERMKRQNDLQMLEKINELDEKLRSLEKDSTERQESMLQLSSALDMQTPGKQSVSSVVNRRKKSVHSSSSSRLNEQQQGTLMTPKEKSLLAQLDKEKKERHQLEMLNKMLQENMHVCLTHIASRGDHSKSAGLDNRTAPLSSPTTLTPRGDGCQPDMIPVRESEATVERHSKESGKDNSSKLSTIANQPNETELGRYTMNNSSCYERDSNSNVINHQTLHTQNNKKDRVINCNKSHSDLTNQLCLNASLSNTLNCTAESICKANCHQNNSEVEDKSVYKRSRSVQDTDTCKTSTDNTYIMTDNEVSNSNDPSSHGQNCCSQWQQHESHCHNLHQNRSPETLQNIPYEDQFYSSDKNVSAPLQNNANFKSYSSNENQNFIVDHKPVAGRSSVVGSVDKKQIPAIGETNTPKACQPCKVQKSLSQKQNYTYPNIDRVLQTHSPELERISAKDKNLNTVQKQQLHCTDVLDLSNRGSHNTDPSHLCQKNKTRGTPSKSKEKAKRILLEYTKAVSKSTCTTPSLSKLATEKSEGTKSPHAVAHEYLPGTKDQIQQTDEVVPKNKEDKSQKIDQEISRSTILDNDNANVHSGSQIKNREQLSPCKAQVASNDKFLKPTSVAPRRRFRMTPQLGANKVNKSSLQEVKTKTCSSGHDADLSDVESEFDFQLLQTAKQTADTQSNFSSKSNNSYLSSHISAKSLVMKHFTRNDTNKFSSEFAERQWTDWSVISVTPKKQQCVPLRPSFSDCGSRRPLFDSPMSVKSVGKIRKITLDDSGIHSPGKFLNISPGGTSFSGSCDSLSTISAYFNEEEEDEDQRSKETHAEKRIQVYKKQDKCPGCQEPHEVDGQYYLNSRTFNIVLETDPNTCNFHRKLRHLERQYIRQNQNKKRKRKGRLLNFIRFRMDRKEKKNKIQGSVYDFESDATEVPSPPSSSEEDGSVKNIPAKCRRKRHTYTEEEEENLLEGVRKMGKSWNQILVTYHFHPSRTAVDLKDKYKSITKSTETRSTCSSKISRKFKPFSMCEERRLRRGIKKFGYSWKTILEQYTFSKGRTAEDLRNKWRCMHKKVTKEHGEKFTA